MSSSSNSPVASSSNTLNSRPAKRARFASPPPEARPRRTRSDSSSGANRSHSSGNVRNAETLRRAQKGKQKAHVSCAQCRQLNLSCDARLPCRSCIQRGCGELCSLGSLASEQSAGEGDQLQTRLIQMRDRINELEQALDVAHSQRSFQKHPLLMAKSHMDVSATAGRSSSFPTPISNPASPPSRKESPIPRGELETLLDDSCKDQLRPLGVEEVPKIVERCRTHSLGPEEVPRSTVQWIRDALPSQEHARFLCEQANTLAIFHNFGQYEAYYSQLITEVYGHACPECPYRLAALLSLLALGLELSCVDDMVSQVAIAYHDLARSALCLPPQDDGVEIYLLMTLLFSIRFLMIFYDDEEHLTRARGIMNVAAHVVKRLHLDLEKQPGKFLHLPGQKRRLAFWELTCLDAVLTLGLGDRNSFPLQEIDIRPTVPPSSFNPTVSIEWRQQFHTRCSIPAFQLMHASPAPKYSSIVILDASIRDFPIPLPLRMPSVTGAISGQSKAMLGLAGHISIHRDFLLLQLHRELFLKAIDGTERFSASHPHVCSVLATFQNACQIISCVEFMLDQAPEACRRVACLWVQIVGAAVGLCNIVLKIPLDPLATLSARQLDKCLALFLNAKEIYQCRMAAEKLDLMEDIVHKAREAYSTAHSNPSAVDDAAPSPPLPSPMLEGSHPPSSSADPYSHVHPILLRLLQQAKARARALRSEGALSPAWSNPAYQYAAHNATLSVDSIQQALHMPFTSCPSSTSPSLDWNSSPGASSAFFAGYPAQSYQESSMSYQHGHQYTATNAAFSDTPEFQVDTGWTPATFAAHSNTEREAGLGSVGDFNLPPGQDQFDLFDNGTQLGQLGVFTPSSESQLPYQLNYS